MFSLEICVLVSIALWLGSTLLLKPIWNRRRVNDAGFRQAGRMIDWGRNKEPTNVGLRAVINAFRFIDGSLKKQRTFLKRSYSIAKAGRFIGFTATILFGWLFLIKILEPNGFSIMMGSMLAFGLWFVTLSLTKSRPIDGAWEN